MTADEYKRKFSVSTLKEMLKLHKELKGIHERSKDQQAIKKEQDEIDALEAALGIAKKEEKEKLIASDLTEIEQEIIRCLKTSALGREGLLFEDLLYKHSGAIKTLKERGVIFNIPANPNQCGHSNYLGVIGEEYPMTREDWNDYRSSLASNTMSFTEFKKERDKGNLMTAEKIGEIVNESFGFYTQEIEDKHFANAIGVGKFINAKSDIDDMVVNRGLRGKALMEQILVEHMPNNFKDIPNPKNPEWFNHIITRRIEFLQRQIANR
jgi:hypothetical protein